jgi:hypothetical protein
MASIETVGSEPDGRTMSREAELQVHLPALVVGSEMRRCQRRRTPPKPYVVCNHLSRVLPFSGTCLCGCLDHDMQCPLLDSG